MWVLATSAGALTKRKGRVKPALTSMADYGGTQRSRERNLTVFDAILRDRPAMTLGLLRDGSAGAERRQGPNEVKTVELSRRRGVKNGSSPSRLFFV